MHAGSLGRLGKWALGSERVICERRDDHVDTGEGAYYRVLVIVIDGDDYGPLLLEALDTNVGRALENCMLFVG